MDFIKQNIFHEIKGKSLQVKNIKENFGNRNIDVLTQRPIKIIQKNLKTQIEQIDVNNIVTLDLKIINHIKPYNNKSPYKIVAINSFNQKISILYFGNFKILFDLRLNHDQILKKYTEELNSSLLYDKFGPFQIFFLNTFKWYYNIK